MYRSGEKKTPHQMMPTSYLLHLLFRKRACRPRAPTYFFLPTFFLPTHAHQLFTGVAVPVSGRFLANTLQSWSLTHSGILKNKRKSTELPSFGQHMVFNCSLPSKEHLRVSLPFRIYFNSACNFKILLWQGKRSKLYRPDSKLFLSQVNLQNHRIIMVGKDIS